ncbi:MAG: DUF4886 domain-containing protein [Myxococcota bacterium]
MSVIVVTSLSALCGCGPALLGPVENAPSVESADVTRCDEGTNPMRVLFLGNSYTARNGGLPGLVQALAAGLRACPRTLDVSVHAPGGRLLVQHADDATTEGTMVHQLLHDDRGWDAVVLQEQSQIPGFPSGDETHEASLAAVRNTLIPLIDAAGARVVLLLTWGYRDGDERNPDLYSDYLTMQSRLVEGMTRYLATAEAVSSHAVAVAPAGLGFQAVYLESPGNAGGERFRGLYDDDGSHPSPHGSYLAAATLLEVLLEESAASSRAGPGIVASDKAWLDEAATQAREAWTRILAGEMPP